MPNIKHVGRLKNNKRKVIVPYRTLPGDPYSALVVFVDTLSADEHDTLINLVESAAGQQAYELAEVMNRTMLPDGRNMLVGFHKTGRLQKIPTQDVEMVPNAMASIALDELNKMIADQQGVALEDLSVKPSNQNQQTESTKPVMTEVVEPTTNTVVEEPVPAQLVAEKPLSDEDLAKQMRSQADALFKEAQRLRKEAEELVPTKKATTKKAPAKKVSNKNAENAESAEQ